MWTPPVLQRLGNEDEGIPIARLEVPPRTVQILLRRCSFFRRPGDPEADLQTFSEDWGKRVG